VYQTIKYQCLLSVFCENDGINRKCFIHVCIALLVSLSLYYLFSSSKNPNIIDLGCVDASGQSVRKGACIHQAMCIYPKSQQKLITWAPSHTVTWEPHPPTLEWSGPGVRWGHNCSLDTVCARRHGSEVRREVTEQAGG
jgi:hypothetical protein